MRSQVRRFLYSRLFAAVLLSGLLTGAGCVTIGVLLFRGYSQRSINAGMSEAMNRLRVFDLMLSRLVRDSGVTGRKALFQLASTFPDFPSAKAASRAELRAAADRLGVDEVYFIGQDGKVFATSFAPDLNLDLFSFNPVFTAFLKTIMGSGKQVDQGVSGSTQTGNINTYQYYNPPGQPFIIEVSTRMKTMVGASYPGHDYASLAATVLGGGSDDKVDSPVRVIDYLDAQGLSIVRESSTNPVVADKAKALGELPRKLAWREGSDRFVLELMDLSVFASYYKYYVLLRVDESYYYGFIVASVLVALAVMGAATLLSFASASASFGRQIALRLETLAQAMERVGRGEDSLILEDGQGDELSSIGHSAAAMVATIRQDAAELRLFARRLEEEVAERARKEEELAASLETNGALLREVDHRVRNNLQLMASLARLESAGASPETATLLAKMELRFQGMAQVQDQIMANPHLGKIDMQPLLEARDNGQASGSGIVEGLGLTIVRALASTQGGSVEILAPGPGGGFCAIMRVERPSEAAAGQV